MKFSFALSLLISFSFSFSACSTRTPVPEKTQAEAFTFHLPGPPAPGSPEDQKDYETLKELQKNRLPEECMRAQSEAKILLGAFYGKPYGPLSELEVAELTHLFEVLSKEAWPLISHEKKTYQRARPYTAHADLRPCITTEPTFSYPSAHAAVSRFYLDILLEIFPDRKDALEKRSEQIVYDRNLGGVHYPSDVRDGKSLGDAIYIYLAKNEQFMKLIHSQALPASHL